MATISISDIELAVAAARDGLGDHPWVRESALRERAYFIGLHTGLAALTSPKDKTDVDRIALAPVLRTFDARKGDHPFGQTRVAECLAILETGAARSGSDVPGVQALAELRGLTEQSATLFLQHAEAACRLLDSAYLEPSSVDELKQHLRQLAAPLT